MSRWGDLDPAGTGRTASESFEASSPTHWASGTDTKSEAHASKQRSGGNAVTRAGKGKSSKAEPIVPRQCRACCACQCRFKVLSVTQTRSHGPRARQCHQLEACGRGRGGLATN